MEHLVDAIVIKGVPPWDGRYDFDLVNRGFTIREWGWMKQYAGTLPPAFEAGYRASDPELFGVFAVIAMHRAGRIQPAEAQTVYDALLDADFGASVDYEVAIDQTEEEEGQPDPTASSNGNATSSGNDSRTSSETSGSPPKPTGMPASVISVSGLERLAT